MARIPANEDPNYLAQAQLEVNPFSFRHIVREAFLLEHDCSEDQEIAKLIGFDKSRLPQIFKNPATIQASTIQRLIEPLKSKSHRRRIVQAWNQECFGADINVPERGNITGERVTSKTLRRVDRLIRESRLVTAAQVALEAAKKTKDWELREALLDRAFFLRQRLDEPGQAMDIARIIAMYAVRRQDNRRLATAHLYRVRVLSGLANGHLKEVEPVLDLVEALLKQSDPFPSPAPPYKLTTMEILQATRAGAYVKSVETGTTPVDTQILEGMRTASLERGAKRLPYQEKFQAYLFAARISLLLHETFQASEYLEIAFRCGDIKNIQALEQCGVVEARIVMEADPENAADYLRGVILKCGATFDFYHKRLSEYDLARFQSSQFPESC